MDFMSQIHKHGINYRYLGLVFHKAHESPHLQNLILEEMIARTAKFLLQKIWRSIQSSEETAFKTATLDFFNTMFGTHSQDWWESVLQNTLREKFIETKSIDFLKSSFGKHSARLFERTQFITGVTFSLTALSRFEQSSSEIQFTVEDLQEMKPLMKCINVWLDPNYHRNTPKIVAAPIDSVSIPKSELVNEQKVLMGDTGKILSAEWQGKPVILTCYHDFRSYSSFTDAVTELSKFDHPNIIKVYGVCPAMTCSVTENAKTAGGQVLKIFLAKNKIGWEEMIRIARGVAAGLKYLHECQPPWLHRNLNTANIFYYPGGTVKINVVKLSREPDTDYTEKNDMLKFGSILLSLQGSKQTDAANTPPVAWTKLIHMCSQIEQGIDARTALEMLNSIVI